MIVIFGFVEALCNMQTMATKPGSCCLYQIPSISQLMKMIGLNSYLLVNRSKGTYYPGCHIKDCNVCKLEEAICLFCLKTLKLCQAAGHKRDDHIQQEFGENSLPGLYHRDYWSPQSKGIILKDRQKMLCVVLCTAIALCPAIVRYNFPTPTVEVKYLSAILLLISLLNAQFDLQCCWGPTC